MWVFQQVRTNFVQVCDHLIGHFILPVLRMEELTILLFLAFFFDGIQFFDGFQFGCRQKQM